MDSTPRNPLPECLAFRDCVDGGQGPALGSELALHGEVCAECAQHNRLRRAQRAALGGLNQRRAPKALDALVAAELARQPVERLLRQLHPLPAPAVLERLVAEEVAEPQLAEIRRHVGGVRRLRAPIETLPHSIESARPRVRAWHGLLALAAAAGLALWLQLPTRTHLAAPSKEGLTKLQRPHLRPPLRYQVDQVASIQDLHPLARAFAEGLSGGSTALSTPVTGEPR